jgi:outer membrane protein assembly factor BamB
VRSRCGSGVDGPRLGSDHAVNCASISGHHAAKTHDQKEVKMKVQANATDNSTYTTFTSVAQRVSSSSRRQIVSCLLALFAVLVSAPFSHGQCPNPSTQPNVCQFPGPGSNYCQSAQYRGWYSSLIGDWYLPSNLLEKYVDESKNNCMRLKIQATTGNGDPLYGYGPGPSSSPAVVTHLILTSGSDSNGNWGLYAYDVDLGLPVWDTITKWGPIYGPIRSSAGHHSRVVFGAEDGNLYAFDLQGNFRWKFQTDAPIDASPNVSFASGRAYIVNIAGSLYALDETTGLLLWPKVDTGIFPGGSSPYNGTASASSVGCVSGCPTLYVAGSINRYSGPGVVKAFDGDTGDLLWSNTSVSTEPVTSSPVVGAGDGLVYVQSAVLCHQGNCDGSLINALDYQTGTLNWGAGPLRPVQLQEAQSQTPAPPCPNVSEIYQSGGSPAFDQTNNLLIASANVIGDYGSCGTQWEGSVLVAYDANRKDNGGGVVKWRVGIGHPISQSSPTIASGVVYIGTDDGRVLAFDVLNKGTQIWDSYETLGQTTGAVISPPVFGYNRIHWNDANGQLWVVGMPSY